MHTSIGYFFSVACFIYFSTRKCSAEYSQDTYLNAFENSHKSTFDNNVGYNYIPPSNIVPIPQAEYGPPHAVYGPPTFHKPVNIYHPREHWILEKLKKKINLFAFGKIILKLLIFKKIVKFIGVICLLLFLPKLKELFKDDTSMEDMSAEEGRAKNRSILTDKGVLERHISELEDFISRSITSYASA
ncbi:uncharacterized protein LOC128866690 [Anastrepha ludens]|uniref:uncharacterized protein LOC128866690 n=1 Tax=Anastrepha ludens TaxID=28586 RepID=UPI0023AF306D|nr:uncharacterized protein LOC128866690 [Anastrepha ludens]